MKRLPLNVLTAVSLLMCLALLVLWARSYVVHDMLQFCVPGHWVIVHSSGGVVFGFDNRFAGTRAFRPMWTRHPQPSATTAAGVERSLISFTYDSGVPSSAGRVLIFPHWAAVTLLALVPAARAWRRLRRRPRRGFAIESGLSPDPAAPSP